MGQEHMNTFINAYVARNTPKVRAQIAGWERELNDSITNQDIPTKEREDMVQDPRNTCGHHTLFRQMIQQYWVMKNVMDRAMTLKKEQVVNKGQEAQEETKVKEPSRVDPIREVATIQIQTYQNNQALSRIE